MKTTAAVWRLLPVLAAATFVFLATLAPNFTTPKPAFSFCVICGLYGTSNAIQNVILFLPLGAALANTGLPLRRVALLGSLLSVAVEVAQFWIPGRSPGIGDLLTNGTGTLLGALVVRFADRWLSRSSPLSWVATAAAIAAFAATAVLLQPVLTPEPWFGHWTPRFRHLEFYRGKVLSAHLDSIPLPATRLERVEEIRTRIFGGADVRVSAVAGPHPRGLASLFHISDEIQNNLFLLGPVGTDLLFRYRTKANTLRLTSPVIRIGGAFEALQPGDTFETTARQTPNGFCITLNAQSSCPARVSIGTGWTFIAHPEFLPLRVIAILDLAWIAGLAFLVGYWSPAYRTLAAQVAIISGAMLVTAGISDLVSGGPLEILAILVGAACGTALVRLIERFRAGSEPKTPQ